MALQNTILIFDSMNYSLQVGDIIYWTTGGVSLGGFNSSHVQNTKKLGVVMDITFNDLGSTAANPVEGQWEITVQYDDTNIPTPPQTGSYISFVKGKRANTTSLLGYYANINFVNDSTEKAELFSFGAEVSESSK